MRNGWQLLAALVVVALTGCATDQVANPRSRPFEFGRDTFAYCNGLLWEYRHDPATGKTTATRREPPPTYAQHCFVMSRAARQFFDHASFDPSRPAADEQLYRRLVREVVSRSKRKPSPPDDRVTIPGYPDLRAFSHDWEKLLKEECGGGWHSYFQCGNWRMVVPFTREQQRRSADGFARRVQTGRPQIAHVVRFPQLTINHAILFYDCHKSDQGLVFIAYDPNNDQHPIEVKFDSAKRAFFMTENEYFAGGQVDVYPAYQGFCY